MFPREFKNWKYKMQVGYYHYYYYYYYYFYFVIHKHKAAGSQTVTKNYMKWRLIRLVVLNKTVVQS